MFRLLVVPIVRNPRAGHAGSGRRRQATLSFPRSPKPEDEPDRQDPTARDDFFSRAIEAGLAGLAGQAALPGSRPCSTPGKKRDQRCRNATCSIVLCWYQRGKPRAPRKMQGETTMNKNTICLWYNHDAEEA